MKLGTNPSDSQSSYASAIHLNSLALISFLSDHVPLLSIVLFLGLMLENLDTGYIEKRKVASKKFKFVKIWNWLAYSERRE